MTEQDREEFIAVLGTVAEAYSKELSDGLVRVYFQQLSKFGIEEIARAGSILMTRSRFWPTIADFHGEHTAAWKASSQIWPSLPDLGLPDQSRL